MPLLKVLVSSLLLVFAATAFAIPGQVLLIRHAEKPADDRDPHLSARGRQRAQALVTVLTRGPLVGSYGPPAAIYAAAPKRDDGSLRSIETVTPLAQALHQRIHDGFDANDEKKLAREILAEPTYAGKTVLVAWAHDELPKVAEKLGVQDPPRKWKKKRFDRVWRITFTAGGKARLDDLPQKALPGDQAD